MSTGAKNVFFQSRDELLRIDLSSIVYFEADGNYTRMISRNGLCAMVCMSLGKIEQFLSLRAKSSLDRYARVGKRYIINLENVYQINTLKQELILSDQRSFSYTLNMSKEALRLLKDMIFPQTKQ